MKIPVEAIIPQEKLTGYLLAPRVRNDKAKFLAQSGFTQENPEALLKEIRRLTSAAEAEQGRDSEYGTFYRVEGELTGVNGVNGVNISVVTIWLQRKSDGSFQFVTLVPGKEHRHEV